MAKPRGIRNNNPGNLDWSPNTTWQGALGIEDKPLDGGRARFVKFSAPHWGIRALGKTLWTYVDKHGLHSCHAIANRWAPPNENDTGAYGLALARAVGVSPLAKVDWKNDPAKVHALVRAIILHENGEQPYSDEQIRKALVAAGWQQDPATVGAKTRAAAPLVAGGAGLAVGGITIADALVQAPAALSAIERLPTAVGLAIVLVAALGIAAWLIWRNRRAPQ
jgi:hypothetical protein